MIRVLIPVLLLPCINYYGKNVQGDRIETEDERADPTKFVRQLISHPEHESVRTMDLGPEPAADADFMKRNDYAANLIRQGKVKRAIEILESIEESRPGEYRVAANLGTAYELSGSVDRALHWASEGIRRYPEIHLGTEWLHVRILEVKRELAKDPNWLQSRRVLDFDFGTEDVPRMPATWGKMGQSRVLEALRFQLHERLAFVSPPDPIVGELIGIYADHAAVSSPVEYALPLYDLALSFKPATAGLLERRRARAERMMPTTSPELPDSFWPLAVSALAGVSLFAILIRRRGSRRSA